MEAGFSGSGAFKKRRSSFASITDEVPLLRVEPLVQEKEGKTVEDEALKHEKLWSLMSSYLSSDVHTIQRSIVNHVEYTLACTRFSFDNHKAYRATAYSIRDRLIESWNDTNQHFDTLDVKRVNYLSLEFLIGRSMQNALLNMDLEDNYKKALGELGYKLEDLYEEETDAALGNGGLGRLAACFLDSMATLDLPAWGYGIRYNYGIFRQEIKDGYQVEVPDYWLNRGNPWEFERVDVVYPVRFYGHITTTVDASGERSSWEGGEVVQAIAHDNPIPGFDTYNTINLRLWKAVPSREFDLASFNSGDYLRAIEERQRAEAISSVLYPSDNTYNGKELRLKQQYFFVSATLRDIIRRFKKKPDHDWTQFADKNAVQLNDTHPSIGIAELMRILVDEERVPWDLAWDVTQRTFAYTNHTILPEALEKWTVDLMGHLLPRHLEIIYKINWNFMQLVEAKYPGDHARARKVSIVEEGDHKQIRMANLAIIGSHAVNGVAAIHSELVKHEVFPEMYELWPERFQNKTNGVTPRRWLNQANPGLSAVITKWLETDEWKKNLDLLCSLRVQADDPALHGEWIAAKQACKKKLAVRVKELLGIDLRLDALFDVQVKRLHEYKRQLLNALYCIHRYQWIKSLTPEEKAHVVPRVVLFGGKAAPGYTQAKKIIKLINSIGDKVNNDPAVGDLFKVIFFPNYSVSNAEIIIPAADLSQHISTAGMEASGTSNMKFAMNGCLIIGTMDGANIEIAEEIDRENMFIFGVEAHEVAGLREAVRTKPCPIVSPEWDAVIASLAAGEYGSPEDVGPILHALEWSNDYYLLRVDFQSYLEAQARVDATFVDTAVWTQKSILSTAGMGKFSTDRTIQEYARDIWGLTPARRPHPTEEALPAGMARVRSFPNFDPNSHVELLMSPSPELVAASLKASPSFSKQAAATF